MSVNNDLMYYYCYLTQLACINDLKIPSNAAWFWKIFMWTSGRQAIKKEGRSISGILWVMMMKFFAIGLKNAD